VLQNYLVAVRAEPSSKRYKSPASRRKLKFEGEISQVQCLLFRRTLLLFGPNNSLLQSRHSIPLSPPTINMQYDDQPNQQVVHGALILAQLFFGVGSVVGALGLPATNPLVFALVRETVAGLLLLGISIYWQRRQRQQQLSQHQQLSQQQSQSSSSKSTSITERDSPSTLQVRANKQQSIWAWTVNWKSFWLLGFFVFGNQAGFIVGIKLAGPVVASVWQPSQPIFTAAICMAMGWEPLQRQRIAGILLAFMGCAAMVLLREQQTPPTERTEDDTNISNSQAGRFVVGNLLFFINCLFTSLYVIMSKNMLALYPALTVTAWSYNCAAVLMFVVTMLSSVWSGAGAFLCAECSSDVSMFSFPKGAIPALVYYIVFCSVGSYGLITWSVQYATGTLVTSCTVLQPVTSALLTTILLATGLVTSCKILEAAGTDERAHACLNYPTFGTFCGMVGVFGGLVLVMKTEPPNDSSVDTTGQDDNGETVETVPLSEVIVPQYSESYGDRQR